MKESYGVYVEERDEWESMKGLNSEQQQQKNLR